MNDLTVTLNRGVVHPSVNSKNNDNSYNISYAWLDLSHSCFWTGCVTGEIIKWDLSEFLKDITNPDLEIPDISVPKIEYVISTHNDSITGIYPLWSAVDRENKPKIDYIITTDMHGAIKILDYRFCLNCINFSFFFFCLTLF